MGRTWRILALLTIFAAVSAGCPSDLINDLEPTPTGQAPGTTSGGSGSSTATSGGSAGSADGGTTDTQDFEGQLAEQFPDCSEPTTVDEWRAEVLRLVNVERESVGLSPLSENQDLEDLATQYACEMIHYDFFAHENPVTGTELRDRAEDFGIRIFTDDDNYFAIGENLAAGQTTPAQAMADWMDSEHHRDNILDPLFTELGVGVRTGGRYGTYWVQEFGRPLE